MDEMQQRGMKHDARVYSALVCATAAKGGMFELLKYLTLQLK